MKCTNLNCQSGLVKKLGSLVVLVSRTPCAHQYPGRWQGSTTLKENHKLFGFTLCQAHESHGLKIYSPVIQLN